MRNCIENVVKIALEMTKKSLIQFIAKDNSLFIGHLNSDNVAFSNVLHNRIMGDRQPFVYRQCISLLDSFVDGHIAH